MRWRIGGAVKAQQPASPRSGLLHYHQNFKNRIVKTYNLCVIVRPFEASEKPHFRTLTLQRYMFYTIRENNLNGFLYKLYASNVASCMNKSLDSKHLYSRGYCRRQGIRYYRYDRQPSWLHRQYGHPRRIRKGACRRCRAHRLKSRKGFFYFSFKDKF